MPEEPTPRGETSKEEVDIEALEHDKARLAQMIDKTSKELDDMIGRLGIEANQVANKVSDEASAVMSYHRSASRKIMETVNNEEARVRETVLSLASSLDYFFWVVAGLLVGFGLVAGYIVSSISRIFLGIFSLAWILGGLGILFILRSKVSALRSRSNDLGQVKEMQEEMTEMVVSLPQSQPDVQLFETSAKALGEAVGTLTSTASELVNTDKQVGKVRSREQFIQSFLMTLNRYGFVIESQSVEKFRKELLSVDDEGSYLELLASESKEVLPNIAQTILKLAYFDCQGNRNETDQIWEVIRKTPSLRIQLANLLVRNKLLAAPNIGESFVPTVSELLMNVQTYSLDIVKVESAGFLERLVAFKVETINHLALFDLNIVEGVVELMAFMPKSFSNEKWRNEVLEYVATELLQIDPNFVQLLVRDAIGDAGKTKYWRLIVKSNSLPGLAAILARKRLAAVHSEFDQSVYLRHLLLAMEASHDDFSLPEIEKNVRTIEDIMITVEKNVKRTSQLYRLRLNDFSYLRLYVPKTIETTEDELIAASAHRLSMKTKIFELLYYSAVGSDKVAECFNEVVDDEPAAKLLADFLISSGFVPKNGLKFTLSLLRARKSFDLTNFVFDYARYEKLLEGSENLWAFMKKKQCCERSKPLSFEEILGLCLPDSSMSYEDQMIVITRKLMGSRFGKNELTGDQQEQAALAVTLLFLAGVGDSAYKSLFGKIAVKLLTCRVLYKYIYLIDQSIVKKTEPRLDLAITESVELRSDDPHFNYFRSQLANGRFIGSASEVINSQMDEIAAQIRKFKKDGFDLKLLDGLVTPLRHALYDALDLETLRTLLRSQTVVAYTLTIPGNHPMNTIIDSTELLEASANALSVKDSEYHELVRLSRPTRIGLVPLEMPFEIFTNKLEKAFHGALKTYSAKSQNNPNSEFRMFYITRIFPSVFSYKEITNGGETERTFEMIRILARSSMTGVECLMLLSILQPVDRTEVAIRNVMQSVLDSSELKLLYQDIDQGKEIQLKFADHTLDTALMSAYNVTKLSSLCKALGEQFEGVGEDRARKKFYESLKKALPEDLKLPPHKEELFIKTLFKRMSSLGAVFKV